MFCVGSIDILMDERDNVPKGMAMSRSRLWRGEWCRGHNCPDRKHLEPPKPGGAPAAEHEALNRGGEALPAFRSLCPGSCPFW